MSQDTTVNVFIKEGLVRPYVNGTGGDIASRAVVIDSVISAGVALGDIADTATGVIRDKGIARVAKTTSQAWTAGVRLYWSASTSKATTTALGNAFIGFASEAAGADDTVGLVHWQPYSAEGFRYLTTAETSLALTVADFQSGEVRLVTTGGSSCTVSLPACASTPAGATLEWIVGGAGAVVIDPNSTELVAGGGTYTATDATGDTAKIMNTGTAWVLLAAKISG